MKELNPRTFGRTPERFTHTLEKALRTPEARPSRKRFAPVLITALLIVLLAATALAIANRVGIFDTLRHVNPENADAAAPLMESDIPMEGEPLSHIDLTLREAYYDGARMHLLVMASPREEGVKVIEAFRNLEPSGIVVPEDVTLRYVNADMGISYDEDLSGYLFGHTVSYDSGLEGDSAYFAFSVQMPQDWMPETVDVNLFFWESSEHVDHYSERAHVLEETALRLTIQRTGTPNERAFDLDADVGATRLKHVAIVHTPLEMTISLIHEQQDKSRNMLFDLLDENGEPIEMESATGGIDEETLDSYFLGCWPSPIEMPETITLLPWEGMGEAFTVNLETGEVTGP